MLQPRDNAVSKISRLLFSLYESCYNKRIFSFSSLFFMLQWFYFTVYSHFLSIALDSLELFSHFSYIPALLSSGRSHNHVIFPLTHLLLYLPSLAHSLSLSEYLIFFFFLSAFHPFHPCKHLTIYQVYFMYFPSSNFTLHPHISIYST